MIVRDKRHKIKEQDSTVLKLLMNCLKLLLKRVRNYAGYENPNSVPLTDFPLLKIVHVLYPSRKKMLRPVKRD